jgi:hypothetical protein
MDKKLRLHVHFPESILEEVSRNSPFVIPTLIGDWEIYLNKIMEKWEECQSQRYALKKNLGYSLQWLEFSSALLLEHYERMGNKKKPSLHSIVETMMVLQFCTFTHAVLEGIGSYIFRVNQKNNKNPENPNPLCYKSWENAINVGEWRDAIKKKIYPKKIEEKEVRNALSIDIQSIISLRNEIHLDTVSSKKTHYEKFGYSCFKLCHQTLKTTLMGLSNSYLEDSLLFEVLE